MDKLATIPPISVIVPTEHQLRASLKEIEDLKAALDEHAIVAITDPRGKITYVNDKFCAISKYTREELLGQDHRIINSGYHAKEFIRDLWATITQGKVWKGEIRNRAKDGSFYWVDTTIVPFLNDSGKPRQYVAIRADISERKRAEEELRRSEVRFATIFRSGRLAMSINAVADGRLLDANDRYCEILGYSREELVGRSVLDLNLWANPGGRAPIMQRLLKERSIRDFETKQRCKSGEVRDVLASLELIELADESEPVLISMFTDITERKQAEEQLRASHNEIDELKMALDEHAIVAITDPQGKITFVNDKFCSISKYARDELLGQDHRLINSGFHPREFIRDLWTTISHGKVWKGEIKNKAKDGSFYWVDTTIVPFLNETGKPRQYVAIRADITERKRMELAMHQSEERFRTMANSIPQLAWIARPDGFIFWYNQRWHDYTGTTPEQMEGSGWQSVHDPAVLPKVMATWTGAIASGKQFEMEFPIRGADGRFRTFLTRGRPVKDADGRVVQWFGTNTDVEVLKKAEEGIRQHNAELEQRVRERTAQLETANQELEAFSYSVSHDLRAPLRAVDGFSRAVEEDYGPQLPPEGRRYLRTIREGAGRMGRLIDDLLTFSRLSRLPLNKQTVDMGRLVKELVDDLAGERAGRDIELRIGELPPCTGDAPLLKQVWMNLLSNALKYTRKRDVAVVEIGWTQGAEGSSYFVRDNGTGFDMRYADKLFGVFQRLHRAEDFEGTGVGLAIVQRVIHRHGGRVWADAVLDRGATFHFTVSERTHP